MKVFKGKILLEKKSFAKIDRNFFFKTWKNSVKFGKTFFCSIFFFFEIDTF